MGDKNHQSRDSSKRDKLLGEGDERIRTSANLTRSDAERRASRTKKYAKEAYPRYQKRRGVSHNRTRYEDVGLYTCNEEGPEGPTF